MLKSTYGPPPGPPPLPPGWTEHKAPSGHSYYYNAETKRSTYTRPTVQPEPAAQDFISLSEASNGAQFGAPFGAQFGGAPPFDRFAGVSNETGMGVGVGAISRGNWHQQRRKPQDRPKHRYSIPACAPWVLIQTRLGRRFVHNVETGESLWKFPEDVMKAVVEWDVQRMKEKERKEKGEPEEEADVTAAPEEEKEVGSDERGGGGPRIIKPAQQPEDEDEDELGSDEEYEEVEVTDDDEGDGQDAPSKRQRTEDPPDDQPMEFNEDDIAWQLQAMEQDYGADEAGYAMDEDEEAAEAQLTEEDSVALFRDLLDDHNINPYRTWDQIIEDGRIIDDDRYIALPNMRSRKDAFAEWSRDKIQALREQREREAQKDPRIPYMAFLEQHASPKLYWPEFKRKHRKEAEMRDSQLSDKDREKWYREYIKRRQLPESTLKSDLSALLKSQPLSALNRSTLLHSLPPAVLSDLRYVSLSPAVREPLVEAYISTLAPAPENAEDEAGSEAKRRDRERREKALSDREKSVQEAKRKQDRNLELGRDRLRAEERELSRAMKVSKDGLRAQLGGGHVV